MIPLLASLKEINILTKMQMLFQEKWLRVFR